MLLNALIPKPQEFRFADQAQNETVHLVARAHPITQIGWITSILFFVFLPIVAAPFVPSTWPQDGVFLFVLLWYATIFSVSLTSYYIWYFNIGIVTSNQIIDVDTGSVLYSDSSSTFIKDIEEIQQSTQGVLSALFDYGDILIQTAGEKPNIEFASVPRPSYIVRTINEIITALPPT